MRQNYDYYIHNRTMGDGLSFDVRHILSRAEAIAVVKYGGPADMHHKHRAAFKLTRRLPSRTVWRDVTRHVWRLEQSGMIHVNPTVIEQRVRGEKCPDRACRLTLRGAGVLFSGIVC